MMQTNNPTGSNFFMLLKKYIVENSYRLLLCLGALVGVMAFLGFFLGMANEGGGKGMYFGFSSLLAVMGIAGASQMFSELKTKEGRIALLMEPATVTAKFMVRMCVWVFGSSLVIVLAFEIGDLMRMLGAALFHHPVSAFTFIDFRVDSIKMVIVTILIYFALQSFFVLGAVVWPKLSFIKTIVAMWVMQTVTGIASMIGIKLAEDSLMMINFRNLYIIENWAYPVLLILLAAVCIINWSISWLRLKETDAI